MDDLTNELRKWDKGGIKYEQMLVSARESATFDIERKREKSLKSYVSGYADWRDDHLYWVVGARIDGNLVEKREIGVGLDPGSDLDCGIPFEHDTLHIADKVLDELSTIRVQESPRL